MDILFHEKMYQNGYSEKKIEKIRKKIQKLSPKLNLFLITLPIGPEGILEIYWYPELLQPLYRCSQEKMIVVGIAASREEAYELVEQIIQDIGWNEGTISVRDYFEERV